jgi:UDP-N-acetylglucosamine 1-carboxyvinyltransferase
MPDTFVIDGGHDIAGDIHVSGSKNAGLALIAATLLTTGKSSLEGVPSLSDIGNMGQILRFLGADVSHVDETLQIDTTNAISRYIPTQLTSSLRASILVLGPLVARFGYAKLNRPGGCTIGGRPIEEHVRGLEKLGARVKVTDDYIEAHASGLCGADIDMESPSVTGTMNLMMAACLAQGVTRMYNAAREPEIVDLANGLVSMGADIQGIGTDHLTISGCGKTLSSLQYKVMEDRIEAGTFLILGAMVGNPLVVHRCKSEYQTALISKLRAMGALLKVTGNSITVRKAARPRPVNIKTGPYPAFSTDLQPQLMALLCLAHGRSKITETIFEMRFNQSVSLVALGADIQVRGRTAFVTGAKELSGTAMSATDLRAGASLVLAAIAAKGRSEIGGIQYIDRGYHELEKKLKIIGAGIKRLPGSAEINHN